jgi:hypothetical protein
MQIRARLMFLLLTCISAINTLFYIRCSCEIQGQLILIRNYKNFLEG